MTVSTTPSPASCRSPTFPSLLLKASARIYVGRSADALVGKGAPPSPKPQTQGRCVCDPGASRASSLEAQDFRFEGSGCLGPALSHSFESSPRPQQGKIGLYVGDTSVRVWIFRKAPTLKGGLPGTDDLGTPKGPCT